jgi:hypothetical protein
LHRGSQIWSIHLHSRDWRRNGGALGEPMTDPQKIQQELRSKAITLLLIEREQNAERDGSTPLSTRMASTRTKQ